MIATGSYDGTMGEVLFEANPPVSGLIGNTDPTGVVSDTVASLGTGRSRYPRFWPPTQKATST